MKRAISATIIVECGDNSAMSLNEAVVAYFESKGFRAATPHIYPEDPLVVEVTEPIPTIRL